MLENFLTNYPEVVIFITVLVGALLTTLYAYWSASATKEEIKDFTSALFDALRDGKLTDEEIKVLYEEWRKLMTK